MADAVTIDAKVIGTAEIAAKFREFGGDVRERLRRAMAQLGASIAEAAAAEAHRKTGDIAASIKPKQTETNNSITETVRPTDFRGLFLEEGTGPGIADVSRRVRSKDVRGVKGTKIVMKNGVAMVAPVRGILSKGKTTFQRRFHTRAYPFMGPAWAAQFDRIDSTLRAAVAASVSEANS